MTNISIERITSVDDEVLEATKRMVPQLGSSSQVEVTEAYLEGITANPDNYWLMARRAADARLIGMASLIIMRVPTNVRASLENLAVDEHARGLGVGVALCLEAKEISDGEGANTLRAMVLQQNGPSKAMLERAGFQPAKSLDYYELNIHEGPRS